MWYTPRWRAVGAVCASLLALVWAFLDEYPQIIPAENTKRVVSVALPFVVVLVCYAILVAQGQTHFDEKTLWAVLYVAVVSITGKQVVLTGYRALRPQATPQTTPQA